MRTTDLLVGAGVGAALTYMMDSDGGRRRRALVRDKMVRATRRTRDGLDATARDLAHRTQGVVAATRGRLSREQVDDARLVERVRAKLGRACSHPRAVAVEAQDGHVTLRGPILAAEVDRLVATVAAVRGVASVSNGLDAHGSAEGISSLQGSGSVTGPTLDIMQNKWAPATQAIVAAAALAATSMAVMAVSRRSHAA